MDQDSTSNPTGTVDPAARESIQRALDQCVERGQIHRLYRWVTKLNKICHGEEQNG
jgi:hypothetical protein